MGNNEVNDSNSLVVKIKQEKIDAEIETKLQTTLTVTVKQEQTENSQNGGSDSCTSLSTQHDNDGEEDEKKTIEPVKSSNEILAELFKVFNAAPPEELLDDKRLLKKEEKASKKHKKEKKKKHERIKVESLSDDGDNGQIVKHKKKKKHKHRNSERERTKDSKDSKDKEEKSRRERDKSETKSLDRIKESGASTKERHRSKERSERSERKENKERDRTKKDATTSSLVKVKREPTEETRSELRKRHHADVSSGNTEDSSTVKRRCKTNKIKIELHTQTLPPPPPRSKDRDDGQISEISLSDEETYLKERERISDKDRRHRSDDSSRNRRERSSTGTYGRSDGWRRRGTTIKVENRKRSSRTRSRSRSRSRSLGIDKKRLLEIARKNAISMFKRGSLPGCANMTEEVKDKVLLKMRYGGRTVQDLTEFCKKISNGENLSDLSSDEDSDVDKCGNAKAFHHPFQLKEREPIVMHIRNSTSSSTSTALVARPVAEEQTKVITMQFPVSSGQQHRMTEAWVPVESKDQLSQMPALPVAKQATNMFKTSTQKNVFGGTVPQQQEQEPAFKPMGGNVAPSQSAATPMPTTAVVEPLPMPPPLPPAIAEIALPPPPVPPPPMMTPPVMPPAMPMTPIHFVPDTAVPSMAQPPQPLMPSAPMQQPPSCNQQSNAPLSNIFPDLHAGNLDVSAIISKRLNAMRRLQDNPLDPEALKMMHSSQRDMSSWASSKHLPGQFTGSTGVTVLKAHELNSGPQIWARRNQLTATRPVTGGMGMQLLQKMGWKPGEGLGRERNGALTPLLFDVKLDKRGLVSKDDVTRQSNNQQPSKKLRGNNGGVCAGAPPSAPPPQSSRPQTVAQAQQNMQDKHPVCLLNELTSKRKWTPPLYQLVNEVGPSHSKMFLFSVSMNGQTFLPPQASNNKKEAKLLAARYCLQQIGILPPS